MTAVDVAPGDDRAAPAYDIAALRAALGDVPVIDEPPLVKQKSRDFYWYSPVLKPQLKHKFADLIAVPRDEADVIMIAAACARLRMPLTVRGAGTGNYGQAVPLAGGLVVDMIGLDRIKHAEPGLVRVEAGKRMIELDRETRRVGPGPGWEQRMHPSTKRTATIGGFVAGGSGGVGSVAYGGMREPGNILGARLVTCEDTPRVIELSGADVGKVNRTYGTTGIMTEVTMPMAPAWPWRDTLVAFDGVMPAMGFGQALATSDGIVKKLATVIAWPIPASFKHLDVPEGRDLAVCMIASPSMAAFRELVREHGGELLCDEDAVAAEEDPERVPLYEYTWNHTTLQLLKADKGITYLQSLFPVGRNLEMAEHMVRHFGDEVLMHAEFIRFDGRPTNSALQIVRYTDEARLNEIIDYHEAHDVWIANPHVYTLEGGSRHKRVVQDQQLAFKAEVDPYGLLNPGKMASYVPVRD